MHFTLFLSLFVLTTFVHSAPTAPIDSTTLLNNALEAQKLNAQFQTANTATGSCTDEDTTCAQGAIASCVNGQFDTSQGGCPATQQCFALPSLNSDGTTIACTSEKIALSLIEGAGATGGITGSGSESSIDPASASSTLSGASPSAPTSTDLITPTSAALDEPVVTVTVTVQVLASSTTTLPSVTQTLSPEEASSLLSSLLAQGGPTITPTPGSLNEPSETPSSTVSATTTDSNIPTATPDSNSPNDEPSEVPSSTASASATNIPSSASPSATPVKIANTAGSPTGLGSADGGDSSY